MEGDKPTGCMVIAEDVELEKKLKARSERLESSDAMYSMIAAMLEKTQDILKEALSYETLIMACILHPAFRLRFFHTFFGKTPEISICAEALFNEHFKKYQESATKDKTSHAQPTSQPESTNEDEPSIFRVYNNIQEEEMCDDTQMRDYLDARDWMKAPKYNMANPQSALAWWKVCNYFLHSLWL